MSVHSPGFAPGSKVIASKLGHPQQSIMSKDEVQLT
jgi:hypothetical protein